MSARGRAPRPARPGRPGRPGRPTVARAQGSGAGATRAKPAHRAPEAAPASASLEPFRLTYVEGATPAKWIRAWGDRMPQRIEHALVAEEAQTDALRAGDADAAIVRLPIDDDELHVVRLYDERAFVVVPEAHAAAELESLTAADLEGEATIERGSMTWSEVVEVVASGAGVALMPQSLARLHQRRDVAALPVDDLPPTTIALAWRRDRDADDVQAFVAITRGRSARSSR